MGHISNCLFLIRKEKGFLALFLKRGFNLSYAIMCLQRYKEGGRRFEYPVENWPKYLLQKFCKRTIYNDLKSIEDLFIHSIGNGMNEHKAVGFIRFILQLDKNDPILYRMNLWKNNHSRGFYDNRTVYNYRLNRYVSISEAANQRRLDIWNKNYFSNEKNRKEEAVANWNSWKNYSWKDYNFGGQFQRKRRHEYDHFQQDFKRKKENPWIVMDDDEIKEEDLHDLIDWNV